MGRDSTQPMNCTLCVNGIKQIVGERNWEEILCWCPAGRALSEQKRKEKADKVETERQSLRQSNK